MIKKLAEHPEFKSLAENSPFCSRTIEAFLSRTVSTEDLVHVLHYVSRHKDFSKSIYDGTVNYELNRLISKIVQANKDHPDLSNVLLHLAKKELIGSSCGQLMTRDVVRRASQEFLNTIMRMPETEKNADVISGLLENPLLPEEEILPTIDRLFATNCVRSGDAIPSVTEAIKRLSKKEQLACLLQYDHPSVYTATLLNPLANEELVEALWPMIESQIEKTYGEAHAQLLATLAESPVVSEDRLKNLMKALRKSNRYRFEDFSSRLKNRFNEKLFRAVWETYHDDTQMPSLINHLIHKDMLSQELANLVKTDLKNGRFDENKAIKIFDHLQKRAFTDKAELYDFAHQRFKKHWSADMLRLLARQELSKDEAAQIYFRSVTSRDIHTSGHAHVTFVREMKKALSKVMTEREFRKINKNHRAMLQFG